MAISHGGWAEPPRPELVGHRCARAADVPFAPCVVGSWLNPRVIQEAGLGGASMGPSSRAALIFLCSTAMSDDLWQDVAVKAQ